MLPGCAACARERPEAGGGRGTGGISAAERVVVATVLIAVLAFEIWFFFFSGSPIGSG